MPYFACRSGQVKATVGRETSTLISARTAGIVGGHIQRCCAARLTVIFRYGVDSLPHRHLVKGVRKMEACLFRWQGGYSVRRCHSKCLPMCELALWHSTPRSETQHAGQLICKLCLHFNFQLSKGLLLICNDQNLSRSCKSDRAGDR